jgi:hypothetical protein
LMSSKSAAPFPRGRCEWPCQQHIWKDTSTSRKLRLLDSTIPNHFVENGNSAGRVSHSLSARQSCEFEFPINDGVYENQIWLLFRECLDFGYSTRKGLSILEDYCIQIKGLGWKLEERIVSEEWDYLLGLRLEIGDEWSEMEMVRVMWSRVSSCFEKSVIISYSNIRIRIARSQ